MAKTTGQWVGTVVGAIAGFFTGGATWYAMLAAGAYGGAIGYAVGGMVDPPKGPHMFGPRLNDLSGQTATYGTVIPRVYGTVGLYGNVFWIENNGLKEVPQNEGGGKGGGGSEVTTYSYYATFAVGLCQGPIIGVRRIWVGSKLLYDAGSNDVETVLAGNSANQYWTLHNGSETQLPDPRMQAALGVANTPAFRGLAYIVLNDYPLADHGNSLLGAQVKVEVVTAGSMDVTAQTFQSTYSTTHSTSAFSAQPTHIGTDGIVFQAPQWNNTYPTTSSTNVYTSYGPGNFQLDSAFTCSGLRPPPVQQHDDDRFILSSWDIFPVNAGPFSATSGIICSSIYGYAGLSILNAAGGTQRTLFFSAGDPTLAISVATDANAEALCWCEDTILVAGATSTKIYDLDLNLISTGVGIPGLNLSASRMVFDAANDCFWVMANPQQGLSILRLARDLSGYSSITLPLLTGSGYYSSSFNVLGDMLVVATGGVANFSAGILSTHYLNLARMNSDVVDLADIVSTEALSSGILAPTDLDYGSLTQQIAGYRIGSVGAIRSAIEPLQAMYPFDAIQQGYKIKFVPRGGSSVATIDDADLGAKSFGGKAEQKLIIGREMDSQLPAALSVKYLDADREYEQNEQRAERLNTDAISLEAIDVPIVMSANEGAAVAERLLYMRWLERHDLSFQLPPTYAHLEPCDIVTLPSDYTSHDVRITGISYNPDGLMEVSGRYNNAALYTTTFAAGDGGQAGPSTIKLAGPSITTLLDIPCLTDAMNTPGFVGIVSGYMAGWPGGALMRSADAGQTWTSIQGYVPPAATVGYAETVLPAPASAALIDKASVFRVRLNTGSLSSVTEAQMLNGANHFAIGADGRWEIIAVQTCDLQGDGSYLLSNLLRGRFGTEWAMGTHLVADRIVLLNTVGQEFITMSSDAIGRPMLWRGVTNGKSIDSAANTSFAYNGVNLECLSPVYLNGNRHPTTNDWTLTWLRRTRIGGEWRDLVDATLGETSEAYEVEIYSSNTYATLKRTLSGLTSATAAYTSAQQVTDFGANQSTLYVKVYQLSTTVGRGYPLTTSITR